MTPERVYATLKERFGDDVKEIILDGPQPHAVVVPQRWREMALFLRDDPQMGFNWLRCLSGVDHLEDKVLTCVYDFHATEPPVRPDGLWSLRSEATIKLRVDRENPHVPSVADIWPAADWHEREAFDMFGIIFDGHPDLRRILCCEDWDGYPLRKDYEFPLEYHGIPATTEYNQTRTVH